MGEESKKKTFALQEDHLDGYCGPHLDGCCRPPVGPVDGCLPWPPCPALFVTTDRHHCWGLDFHSRDFQDRNLKTLKTWFSRCGISILRPGFHIGGFTWSRTWNFFDTWFSGHGWEPGDFTMSEGHGHPLVNILLLLQNVSASH